MRLTSLTASSDLSLDGADRDITGITADSREVKPGFLFAAIPGARNDGRAYIKEAVQKGATALLLPRGTPRTDIPANVAVIEVKDMRPAVSLVASRFYPGQPGTIAAVTGTSGKTSTAQFARQIWQALGRKSASIGTLGYVTAQGAKKGELTTPDAITLHRLLSEAADNGVTHLAMEASSHGLALNRLDNVRVKAAGFTNFSRDHLDFHGTMEKYLAAKRRLFEHILPPGGTAVLNADIPEFALFSDITRKRGIKMLSYGQHGKDLKLESTEPFAKGQVLQVSLFGRAEKILLPVIGKFQAWNGLCALGLAVACGEDAARAAAALAQVSGVPGRLELAGHTKDGAAVFVDYAHKPDALENVLRALRPHAARDAKLGIVFGCGGDRDQGKRPMMGEIAGRLADWVIVTDDNPRREDPAAIRKEIRAGCKAADLKETADRAEAIAAGIARLGAGDVLVIAGKGHEQGQIVGDKVLPFDDLAMAQKILETA